LTRIALIRKHYDGFFAKITAQASEFRKRSSEIIMALKRRTFQHELLYYCLVGYLTGLSLHASAAEDVLLQQYDVFSRGELIEGLSYDTYRIPNIARANDGTLIAVAEARLSNSSDPGGTHIDLVYKRSLDNGMTWSPGEVLDRHPDTVFSGEGVPTNRTSAANSVTFVNRNSGRVWNLNIRLPHATPSASTQPGVDDMQTWARFSDDSGATWSTPTHIVGNNAAIPYEDFYPNLGSATQLNSGRLIVPATEDNATVSSRSFALYSDDNGASWSAGAQVDAGTNEAQIVELADGRLLMSARPNGGTGRKFATSDDQGETWNPSYNGFTSTRVMEAIERYTEVGTDGETVNRLLHTIPVGPPNRHNLEVMIATNEADAGGPTFGDNRRIYHGNAAYSDLVNIDGDEVGTLFEGENGRIVYSRFNRAFLEPTATPLGLIALEGFDYEPGRTLDSVNDPVGVGEDYFGGYAPVNFGSRRDLDLIFTLDTSTGGGTQSIDPGIASNDQASGILGQIFTSGDQAGSVSQITIERAPNGSAGPPVYLHVYSDTDLSDGIDTGSFLGSSLAAEDLNPTDSGATSWAFDGSTINLSPTTKYLFAFANSDTAGDTTSARAALNVSPGGESFAMGGNGFNSTWRDNATDLTDGPGATDAVVMPGSLAYTNFRLSTTGNHVEVEGGVLARGLGVGLDLNSDDTHYVSLLLSRSNDSGTDDLTDEALELALQDFAGATQVSFGVDSSEAFFLDGPGGQAATAADALLPASTYFLVLKIASVNDSNGGRADQLFLRVFETGEQIPDYEDNLDWTLVGDANTNIASTIDRLSISGGESALWSIDELRVGGDFGSVASGVSLTFAGDLNLDGVLDLLDWVKFKEKYGLGTSDLGPTNQLIAGDLDRSGAVDVADFIAFRAAYENLNGQGSFGALVASVPEPNTLVLLAIGALAARVAQDHGSRLRILSHD